MKMLLGAFIGGGVGFGVGYLGKCVSGACPLTGDPVIITLIGVLIGIIISMK